MNWLFVYQICRFGRLSYGWAFKKIQPTLIDYLFINEILNFEFSV